MIFPRGDSFLWQNEGEDYTSFGHPDSLVDRLVW
jgi:hypothetical protein